MRDSAARINLAGILLAVAAAALPLAALMLLNAGAPSVRPSEAREELARGGAILLDVRSPANFRNEHVEGALNLPLEQILNDRAAVQQVLAQLGTAKLFVICQSGIRSIAATRRLRGMGYSGAVNVAGGIEAWIKDTGAKSGAAFCCLRRASGDVVGIPLRDMSPFEEWIAFASGFIMKPVYTLLSLVLFVLLWRRRSPGLTALKWAMIFFFVGENFCAANYIFRGDSSALFELWHCTGMALCFAFSTYAAMEGVDEHMVQYSEKGKKCSLLGFCRECVKYKDVPCRLQRLFLFFCPAMAIVALMPLCAGMVHVSYNAEILGTLYNYSHSVVYQFFETRLCPVLAVALFTVTMLILLLKKNEPVRASKAFFAAASGALGFSMLRFVIFRCYQGNMVWFVFWEEMTEFLFIAGVVAFLYVFRKQLRRIAQADVPGESGPAAH